MQIMSNLPASYSYQQRQNNNVQFGSKESRIKAGIQSKLPDAMKECAKMYEGFEKQGAEDINEAAKKVSTGVTEQATHVIQRTNVDCPPPKKNWLGVKDSDFTKRIKDAKKNGTLRDGQPDTTMPSGSYGNKQLTKEESYQPTTKAAKRFEDRFKIDWIK